MAKDSVTDRIRAFLADHFPAARSRRLDDEDRLLANGILDSLGVLDLVAFLEKEFEITVSDDDLVPDHFETLGRLGAFVQTKRRTTGSKGRE
jgi:acyl carrier protein